MLVQRRYFGEHLCAQQGSYLRDQKLSEIQHVMKRLEQFPMGNFQGVNKVSAYSVQAGWPIIDGCSTHLASSSEPTGYINQRLVSGGSPCSRSNELTKASIHDGSKLKQEVSAFGPKHAERARRIYQENQRFQRVLAPLHGPTFGPVQVSCYEKTPLNEGSNLLGQPAFGGAPKQTTLYSNSTKSLVPGNVAYHSLTKVIRIAKISPRPKKKQGNESKLSFSFGGEPPNKRLDHVSEKKSEDFRGSGLEMDLSNAPLFQILCEISNIQ